MVDKDKVIILGGTDTPDTDLVENWERKVDDVYLYALDSRTFTKIGDLSSMDKKIYNFHPVLRRDGKVVIFNNSEAAGVAEDQSTHLIELDREHGYRFDTVINNQNDYHDGRVYTKTLVCNNGNVIRISSSPYEPQAVYTYKTKEYVNRSYGTEIVQPNVITDLVVPANTTIVIDNPYRYTSITIEGSTEDGTSGKLQWIGKQSIRELDADDLIVTRSMSMNQVKLAELLASKEWKNVIMLEDANITSTDGEL